MTVLSPVSALSRIQSSNSFPSNSRARHSLSASYNNQSCNCVTDMYTVYLPSFELRSVGLSHIQPCDMDLYRRSQGGHLDGSLSVSMTMSHLLNWECSDQHALCIRKH